MYTLEATHQPILARKQASFFERMSQSLVASRPTRVLLLLGGIWILNAFDLLFTIMSYQHGMLYEENPLARHLLSSGPIPVIMFKLTMVIGGSVYLVKYRHHRIVEMAVLTVLLTYASLALRWHDFFQLVELASVRDLEYQEVAHLMNGPIRFLPF